MGNTYKYEIHMHTSESSKCARVDAKTTVKAYSDKGYAGVFITDHFLNGNTTVPADLLWKDRVNAFAKGYENAKEAGDRCGLDVFFGWEYCFGGTDFLTYGLSKQWLMENPQCLDISVKQYCALVHDSGGYIIHAHPFRESANAYSIEMIRLMPRDVDAVETYNANRSDFENDLAEKYADAYGLAKVCGSDNHRGEQNIRTALEFDKKLDSSQDFIERLKQNSYRQYKER